ncbi:MAG: ISL3 family transposase, partial [Propionibacteriaceae bacterium]
EALCERRSFTQTSDAIRPRARVTQRLRDQLADSIARSNRAVSEVAAEYGVSWPTAHRALIAAAIGWLPEPTPTSRLGIDETRARSVRWITSDAGWIRSDPWMTSFVDCTNARTNDRTSGVVGAGSLLGLVPGRSGACVKDWLNAQTHEFRAGIELVVIDPSAPYASGIRAALPHARIAVDKWHLVALANQMVTEVRQRVTRTRLGRRGTTADRVWNNRLLLLTGADHLSVKQWDRLMAGFDTTDPTADPTGELGAAWGVKERLRLLLGEHEPSKIRWRLADFYDAVIDANIAETTRLGSTVQTWWPAILTALTEGVSNARTEGFNRIIKQVKRVSVNRPSPMGNRRSCEVPGPAAGEVDTDGSVRGGTPMGLHVEAGAEGHRLVGPGGDVELVNRFLAHLSVRNLAAATRRAYAFDLLSFLRFCDETGLTLAGVGPTDVFDYLGWRPAAAGGQVVVRFHRVETAPATKNRRVAALRALFE